MPPVLVAHAGHSDGNSDGNVVCGPTNTQGATMLMAGPGLLSSPHA